VPQVSRIVNKFPVILLYRYPDTSDDGYEPHEIFHMDHTNYQIEVWNSKMLHPFELYVDKYGFVRCNIPPSSGSEWLSLMYSD